MKLFSAKTILVIIAAFIFLSLCIVFTVSLMVAIVPAEIDALSDWNTLPKIVLFTLKQAFFSTLLALCIGIPTAYFTACKQIPGSSFLLSFSAVPLCVPPLLVALGYVMFFGMQGVANRFVMNLFNLKEPPFTFLYSFWGIVIAQGFYNFPLVMKTCHDTWKKIPQEESNAAMLLGASPLRIFRTITIVQLTPAIISSSMVVFLYCFFSFVIVMLFGGVGTSVLEVEIYQSARSSLNMSRSSTLALVETGIAATITVFYGILESKSASSQGMSFLNEKKQRENISYLWQKITTFFLYLLIVLFFIAPLISILTAAFTEKNGGYHSQTLTLGIKNFTSIFSRVSFWQALGNTILIGLSTAILSVTAALFYCCFVKTVDSNKKNIFLRTIPLLPMAVSSVVLGFGITCIIPKATPMHLCFMQAATCWPFAYRQIIAAMDRIPQNQLNATKILSPNPIESIFRINISMCKTSIISALGFCFAISCGDTTLPLVLAIPKLDTLALYTYKLASSYRFNEACTCGLILAMLTMPIFIFSSKFGKKENP